MSLHEDLEKRFPVGSSIAHARKVLKLNRCECKTIDEMAGGERAADTREQLQRSFERLSGEHGADFLWCDRYSLGFLIARRWQIIIAYRDGKVTRILEPTTGLIGP